MPGKDKNPAMRIFEPPTKANHASLPGILAEKGKYPLPASF